MRASLVLSSRRVEGQRLGLTSMDIDAVARAVAGWSRTIREWTGLDQNRVAPAVGFEPTTKRLTAARSTTELRRNGREHEARTGHARVAGRKDTAGSA